VVSGPSSRWSTCPVIAKHVSEQHVGRAIERAAQASGQAAKQPGQGMATCLNLQSSRRNSVKLLGDPR
jgi:hypothetical protein